MTKLYAVLGAVEFELIAWLDSQQQKFAVQYAQQELIGKKSILQHTGFAPDELRIRVLLHSQWCQPAKELGRLRQLMDRAQPSAFVLGSGEYRGVFVIESLDVTTIHTDASGVAMAIEADAQLKECAGGTVASSPLGVIAGGLSLPVGAKAMTALGAGPFSALSSAVASAVSAVGQVAGAVSSVASLAKLASAGVQAPVSLIASRSGGLQQAAAALPVAAFEALGGTGAVADVAVAFATARSALTDSAALLLSKPPSAALLPANEAQALCVNAGPALARLAASVAVRS